MTLCEELYFEITLTGIKSELKKFISFLKSGELDEFFEMDPSYIDYKDGFEDQDEGGLTGFTFSNDDIGIEIGRFDVEEFLDVFCYAGRRLDIVGHIYDLNDDEYNFTSDKGSSDYLDSSKVDKFNDELDEAADDEENDEEDFD
jgi:hypothetical protein